MTDEQVDQDKRWTQEDYEVFQREYFRAPNPAGFLSELESDLLLQAHVGINVRVIATDGGDNDALREAVTDAALAMTNEVRHDICACLLRHGVFSAANIRRGCLLWVGMFFECGMHVVF